LPSSLLSAVCEENRSLCGDLNKWKDAPWKKGDVVVACQLISHEAEAGSLEPLPANWREVLEEVNKQFPRVVPPRSVRCRSVCPDTLKPIERYATIEFFGVPGPE